MSDLLWEILKAFQKQDPGISFRLHENDKKVLIGLPSDGGQFVIWLISLQKLFEESDRLTWEKRLKNWCKGAIANAVAAYNFGVQEGLEKFSGAKSV